MADKALVEVALEAMCSTSASCGTAFNVGHPTPEAAVEAALNAVLREMFEWAHKNKKSTVYRFAWEHGFDLTQPQGEIAKENSNE